MNTTVYMLSVAALVPALSAAVSAPESGLFPAQLVVDLSEKTSAHREEDSMVPQFAAANGVVYFFQDDGIHGRELWRTDGTALGTSMVRDVCPGLCGAELGDSQFALAAVGGMVFFAANDGVHGAEVWVTDGTASGTVMVLDVKPGARSSRPTNFLAASGQILFSADDGVHGSEIWRSDGTPQGTWLIADIAAGPVGSSADPFAAGADFQYVAVEGDASIAGLWRSDGTTAGTFRISLARIQQPTRIRGSSSAVLPNGLLLFTSPFNPAQEGNTELWISDGTPEGTHPLVDLASGSRSSGPHNFERAGSSLYFTAEASSDPNHHGPALWRTDGTASGTVEIPFPSGLMIGNSLGTGLSSLVWAGGRLFFAGWDAEHGTEPRIVDTDGVRLLKDVRPGPESSVSVMIWDSAPIGFAAVDGRFVFIADDGVSGYEFWSSDGSADGTVRISDFAPGTGRPHLDRLAAYSSTTSLEGRLYLRVWYQEEGHFLWASDGTAVGTVIVLVTDSQTSAFYPTASPGPGLSAYGIDCMAPAGERLAFAAETDNRSRLSIWGTDGTVSGTAELAQLGTYPFTLLRPGCTTTGALSLFQGLTGSQPGVFASDGSQAGTRLLTALDIQWRGAESSQPVLVPVGGRWVGNQVGWGSLSWWIETDLTAQGTTVSVVPVGAREIVPDQGGGVIGLDGELSRSVDATASSLTSLLAADGEAVESPKDPASVGARLLFLSSRATTGTELWATNGSSPGTGPVLDLNPGPHSAFDEDAEISDNAGLPRRLVSLGPLAVMAADDGVHGTELWRTDGTAAGTTLFKDIYPGSYPSTPRDLVRVGDTVYFTAEDELHGLELWVTDGTTDGTHLVRDLVPGAESSVPQELTEVRGRLYFTAWRPSWGREAFQSDGTEAGTLQVSDVWPGTGSSSPSRFAAVRDTLYFAANDGEHGFELFKVVDSTLLDVFADGFEGGSLGRWSRVAAP